MSYYGSWAIDDNLTFCVNTTRFDTGAATDADAVPAYRVYEDETGTAILTGNMALLDSANTAGFYSEQIALTAANGFEAGKCYSIYISATVNSVAGATHHNFQIAAKVNAVLWNGLATVALPLAPTTAGRTLDVSAGGEAGVDWANVGGQATAVNLSATNIDVDQVVASVTGAVASVTGGVGGDVAGDVLGDVIGSVGSVVGLNPALIDVATSTRLAAAAYTTPPTEAAIADKILGRTISGGADGGRTVYSALAILRNKTDIAAGVLTVYAEDDTTPAWTAAVTTAAGNPISQIDPS